MNFDIEIRKKSNNKIYFGIIKDGSTILFIKAGQDGSMYGYKNTYLVISKNINKNME